MNIITAIASAFGNLFRFLWGRSEARNRPDVVDGKKRADEAAKVSKTEDSVRRRDVDEARNELAE